MEHQCGLAGAPASKELAARLDLPEVDLGTLAADASATVATRRLESCALPGGSVRNYEEASVATGV